MIVVLLLWFVLFYPVSKGFYTMTILDLFLGFLSKNTSFDPHFRLLNDENNYFWMFLEASKPASRVYK